jgi:hypothetical protein
LVPHGKQLRVSCHAGGVADGRNEIAQQFLDGTDCEWLFMVDSDMGFGPDTVERLIASSASRTDEKSVVGGLCFGLRRDGAGEHHGTKYVVVPTLYELVADGVRPAWRSILDYSRDDLVPVNGTGAACLLIHRSHLVALREQFGDTWFAPVNGYSEDLSFCVRLAAAEIPLCVDTSVRTTHHKGGVFLDEDEYDRCRALHATSA